MTSQEASNIASIVEAVAAVIELVIIAISVTFIWRQLEQQTKLTKASNVQALVNIASPFNLLIAQDEKIAELWLRGPGGFQTFTEVQKIQYRNAMIWHLMLYENVYLQNQSGLLDNYMYCAWNADLERFITRQNLKEHWDYLKGAYHKDFRRHLDDLIYKKGTPNN